MKSYISLIAVTVILSFTTKTDAQDFYIHENGVTIVCDNAGVGDTWEYFGVVYTKRTADQITSENALTTCTSGITKMIGNSAAGFIRPVESFNDDISHWDVSSVIDMQYMFANAQDFNQNLSYWDVASVTDMDNMFNGASSFNQDISQWCVANITSEPNGFSTSSSLIPSYKPVWGTCPDEPSVPEIVYPIHNQTKTEKNIDFRWIIDSLTTLTQFQLFDEFGSVIIDTSVTSNRLENQILGKNQTFFWKIKSINENVIIGGDFLKSEWSNLSKFTTSGFKKINVPEDYSTIQLALNNADSGNVVFVSPGTYQENIIWPDKNSIQLISEGDTTNTIIDGRKIRPVIYSLGNSSEIKFLKIEGFKITNGIQKIAGVDYGGAGIVMSSPNAKVEINQSNVIFNEGIGIYVESDSADISNSSISYNFDSNNDGGGIQINGSFAIIDSSIIEFNKRQMVKDYGNIRASGITILGEGSVISNSIINNNFLYGGGCCWRTGASALAMGGGGNSSNSIINTLFTKNNAEYDVALIFHNRIPLLIDKSTIYDNPLPVFGSYQSSTLTLTNSIIAENSKVFTNGSGLSDGNIIASNNSVINNDDIGVATGSFENSTFLFNKGHVTNFNVTNSNYFNNDGKLLTTEALSMINNYWGHKFGPYHEILNPTGKGDSVSISVDIDPYLTSPSNLAPPIPAQNVNIDSTNNTNLHLSWNQSEIGDFKNYKLYYDTDESGYPYTNSIELGSDTTYSLTNLNPSTTYYVSVTVIDIDENESWYSNNVVGTTRSIEVRNLTFKGEKKLQNVVEHRPLITFDYYDSMEEPQTSYELEVSGDSTFDSAFYRTGEISSDETTHQFLGSDSFAGAELVDGLTYYLRVRVSSNGFYSNWESLSFRMNSIPTIPKPVYPKGDSVLTSSEVILGFNQSTDPELDTLTYNIQVGADSLFTSLIDSTNSLTENDEIINWTLNSELEDNGQYFWRVFTYDGYEYSDTSNVQSFLVNSENDTSGVFELKYPVNSQQISTTNPIISWFPSIDPDPLDTVRYSLSIGSEITNLKTYEVGSDTTYTLEGLEDNTTYYWKVVAKDAKGTTRENTGGYTSFRVNTSNDEPSVVTLITPTNNSVEITELPKFVWNPSDDLDEDILTYELFYSQDSLFIGHEPIGLSETKYFPQNELEDNSKYYWKIHVNDDIGDPIPSQTFYFWVNTELEPPSPFELISPSNNEQLTTTRPTFNWNRSIDNDPNDYAKYTLVVSKDSLFTDLVLEQMTSADTTYTPEVDMLNNAKYYWKVIATDTDSLVTESKTLAFILGDLSVSNESESVLPDEYILSQNYPNPFNPSTQIQYALPEATQVTLEVYNSVGQKVMELVNGQQSAGYHTATFDASGLSSGVYLYKLTTPLFTETKKMLLIK